MTGDNPIPLQLADDDFPVLLSSNEDGSSSDPKTGDRSKPAPGIPRLPSLPNTVNTAPAATKPAAPASTSPTNTQQPAGTAPAQTDKVAPPAPGAQPVTAAPAPAGSTGTTQAEPAAPGATPDKTKPADASKPEDDKGGEDGKDADAKPAIDPSQLLQMAPQLISPVVTAATSALSMPFTLLSGLMSPFGAIMQSLGQGTPANPTSNGMPDVKSLLNGINPSDAGTDPALDSYAQSVDDHKGQADELDSLERELNGLVAQSGQNTTVNRDKIKEIIATVQAKIQALGPVANTVSGQAQVATTIAQGLAQAGAVVANAKGQDGISATKIQELASRFTKSRTSGNSLTSAVNASNGESSKATGTGGSSELASLTNNSSKQEIARAILAEAKRRGFSDAQATAILSTALQESGLNPGARGAEGPWNGIFQQDASYPGRNNASTNINEFFNRLQAKVNSSGASSDIWKNIFWLQQRPGESSADAAFANGRQAYLTEIKSQYSRSVGYYRGLQA